MSEKNNQEDAKSLAWKLFKESGNINYYNLYKALANENDDQGE